MSRIIGGTLTRVKNPRQASEICRPARVGIVATVSGR
jgi:hypothetical protein